MPAAGDPCSSASSLVRRRGSRPSWRSRAAPESFSPSGRGRCRPWILRSKRDYHGGAVRLKPDPTLHFSPPDASFPHVQPEARKREASGDVVDDVHLTRVEAWRERCRGYVELEHGAF